MKTDTQARILQIIEKAGKVRPIELRQALKISAQMIHRHLRALTQQGLIESKGSAPLIYYMPAGVPELDKVSQWVSAQKAPKSPDAWVCETREVFSARLPRLKSLNKNGLSEALLPLVISTAGEIGNNSFDHNLGQWRDIPGCWFEFQVTGKHLWVCIADRGQGVYQSLVKVHPELKNEQAALQAAFETIISGRAPEKRGNGLKFVKKNLSDTPGGGVACISGSARVSYGDEGARCLALLDKQITTAKGTVTLMVWGLS